VLLLGAAYIWFLRGKPIKKKKKPKKKKKRKKKMRRNKMKVNGEKPAKKKRKRRRMFRRTSRKRRMSKSGSVRVFSYILGEYVKLIMQSLLKEILHPHRRRHLLQRLQTPLQQRDETCDYAHKAYKREIEWHC
jgi:hypothetical protein